MEVYKVVAESDESTVIGAYTPRSGRSPNYQSESELESELIRILCEQGYGYLPIHGEAELVANLRARLEELNGCRFTEQEWRGFFDQTLANPNDGILEKTTTIQTDYVKVLKRDDGSHKNICLFDKKNIHNNRLQVIHQYAAGSGRRSSRYDVTILVNGLPLVHIELKRRGVSLREAFHQIQRYQEESFWTGSGLFEYVQVFVISNGTETKYYSNTTRDCRVREEGGPAARRGASRKTSDSFEFTSYWADAKNRRIPDLVDFAKTFLAHHTILNILAKYCVLATERNGKRLMVMRPYQIVATERILERIRISAQYHKTGTLQAGGFIWHTTGSGKTLTSFKTAQLATSLDCVDKVLFVVDRKDLDSQTIREYEKFEKGCVSENKSTRDVQRQLEDPARKIIVTTIQKLSCFIAANKDHEVYRKRCVIIFDECHRSQFGEMHARIVNAFRHYHLFGFTGTPIFPAQAAGAGGCLKILTTEQTFGDRLHEYTIVDAISDHTVLPFRISYNNTIRQKEGIQDKKVSAIDEERVLGHPERIRQVTAHILQDFDNQTRRNRYCSLKEKRLRGFNAMFAVSSIPMAMKYYDEFQRQLAEKHQDLVVATIFSCPPNGDDLDQATGLLPDEDFDTSGLDTTARDFLEQAIHDYNRRFHANYSARDGRFENYYKDLSERVKNREVDLLIVVNMFLTGFDAKTLNTLWVDKNLRYHGLLQAFSRTNRILDSVKTFGNVICFRNLKKQADEAIALFGNKDAGGVVFIRPFQDYWEGYDDSAGKHHAGYVELVQELTTKFPVEECAITGESRQKEFIRLFGALVSLRNLLAAFQDFKKREEQEPVLSPRDLQDYQSLYLDLYDQYRGRNDAVKENIDDDVEFEIELIRQEEVNVDYILLLVEKYRQSNCRDKELLIHILKTADATPQLRSKKELIEGFLEHINLKQDPLFDYGARDILADWRHYVLTRKEQDLQKIIDEEQLRPRETRKFVENCFRNDALKTTGTAIDDILPRMSRFAKDPDGPSYVQKKEAVVQKLRTFFEKYLGLGIAQAREDAPESAPENSYLLAAEEEGPYDGASR